jgi:pimeloyl-ACP methyl ester carboxylesterase
MLCCIGFAYKEQMNDQTESAKQAPDGIGNLFVAKTGNGCQPVILLPGLGCGPWIFESLTAALPTDVSVYMVTVAGFNGTAPSYKPVIQATLDSLLHLIEKLGLVKPVLIAHSIGGTIALKIASLFPHLLGRTVIVDAAPRFLEDETIESHRTANLALAEELFGDADRQRSKAMSLKWIKEMVMSDANVERINSDWRKSDKPTLRSFFVDGRMLAFGLDVTVVTIPLLVIAPFERIDEREEVLAEFQRAYDGASTVEVELIGPARHFAMLDQPEATNQEILRFLEERRD